MDLNLINVIINDRTTAIDLRWNGNYQVGTTGTPGVGTPYVDDYNMVNYPVIATLKPGESIDIFGDQASLLRIQDPEGTYTDYWTKQFAFIATDGTGSLSPGQSPAFVHQRTQLVVQKVLEYPSTQLLSMLVANPANVLFGARIYVPEGATIVIKEQAFPGATPQVIDKANEILGQPIYNLEVSMVLPAVEPPEITSGKHVGGKALWWGYQIYLDETATKAVTGTVAGDIEQIIEDIVSEIPEIGEIINAIVTAYFDIENEGIKLADQGKGVTLSACWLAPVLLIPTPIDMG